MSMAINGVNILLYLASAVIIPLVGIGVMYSLLGVITVIALIPISLMVINSGQINLMKNK